MDILSLANEALVTYIKGKVANLGDGKIDIAKLINVGEMVAPARECWEKLSGGDQEKLVSAIAAMAGAKSGNLGSMLGGIASLAKGLKG